MARLDLTDVDWHRRPYNAGRAYADSKLANLLFTSELDRRLLASGSRVRALAAHPGLVKTAIYERPAGQRPNLWTVSSPSSVRSRRTGRCRPSWPRRPTCR